MAKKHGKGSVSSPVSSPARLPSHTNPGKGSVVPITPIKLGQVGTRFVDHYGGEIMWVTAATPPDDPTPAGMRVFTVERNKPQNWVPIFLEDLAANGLLVHACEVAGTTREVVHTHRRQNTVFAEAYQDALLKASEKLERVARDRAVEYSDTLMVFLLKGTNPDKFGDKLSIRTESEVRQRVSDLATKMGLDPEELLTLATEILANWDPVANAVDVTPTA